MEYISNSCEETIEIAKEFSRKLSAGDIILLTGDLGSGKSVFARAVIQEFGIKQHITSPTFTIVNEYVNENCKFYHFDMYRLEDSSEALAIGADEMLADEQAIKLVEWPENVADIIPNDTIKVSITKLGDNERKIIIEGER